MLVDESCLLLDGVYEKDCSTIVCNDGGIERTSRDAHDLQLIRPASLKDDVIILGIPEGTGFLCASCRERLGEEEDGDGLTERSAEGRDGDRVLTFWPMGSV